MSTGSWRWRVAVLAVIGIAAPWPLAWAGECVPATRELAGMQAGVITVTRDDGSATQMPVRVADDARERAAGFQHICPATVSETQILFLFPRPTSVAFHMNNVHAPLDIAFIDEHGRIIDIQHMAAYAAQPGRQGKRYYRPPARVSAALETRPGLFASLGVTAGNARIDIVNQ